MKRALIAAALVAVFAAQVSATAVCELVCLWPAGEPQRTPSAEAQTATCHPTVTADEGVRISPAATSCEHVVAERSLQTQRTVHVPAITAPAGVVTTIAITSDPGRRLVVDTSPPRRSGTSRLPLRI